MKKLFTGKLLIICFLLLGAGFVPISKAQLTPAQAGYIDAVADYGAVNDGVTVTTTQLQNAINAAIQQGKGLFLPAGQYLIDGTLHITPPPTDQKFVMQGSSVDPTKRSVLILKAGTFPNFIDNVKTNLGFMLQNDYGYDDGNGNSVGTTTCYERIVQSIDFKIQENNAGAVALNYRGAEGTCAFDINIDATGAYAGIFELPGSGGSVADISIVGGQVGIDITHNGGTQPTPTITDLRMSDQTVCCIKTNSVRGALTLIGADIKLNQGVSFHSGRRHTTYAYRFGGCPVVSDSKFEYTSPNTNNVLFKFDDNSKDASVNFSNVYVKNAAKIVDASSGSDVTVEANTTGWRHYTQFSYDAGTWVDGDDTYDDGIYLEGSYQAGNVLDEHTDVENSDIPANLTSIHGWGETFPSFESEGVVSVLDYSALVDNDDWAPAFNAAINAAASTPSQVVFVPTGQYNIYQTIKLGLHTKLIGVSHHHSVIFGWDKEGRRFDGSDNAWDNPRPMIETLDDLNADNILADMGVRMVGPYNGKSHNPEPCVHYAILWRAGQNSIIRNLNTETKTSTNYRAGLVMTYELSGDNWINMQAKDGIVQLSGFNFSQDNASQFLNHTPVPDGHWLETVNGSKRLMAKSISPINNHPDTEAKMPNITIKKTDNSTFNISTIKVAQASFNPKGGDDITIECYNGSTLVHTTTVLLKGLEKPRDEMETVTLNQTGLTHVVITSPVMFSIDDVVLGGTTIDFESLTGDGRPEQGRGYQSALYYDCARDLPLSYLNHHIVEITGGVKWYNHRKHGDTWMLPTQAYVAVVGNKAPVNFYHFHAQHSQNDNKLYIEDGRDVTVWGIKTENAGYFAKAYNSDNIRIFGHGGLTTPPTGTAHYYFENVTNYSVSAPSDELDREDYCQYCSTGSAILAQSAVGTYTSLIEKNEENILKPDPYHRPIIWERGNPEPAYYVTATSPVEVKATLVYPLDGTNIELNSTVKLTAVAVSPIDEFVRTDFYVNGVKVGQDTEAPFQYSYTFAQSGTQSLLVKAYTADGSEVISAQVQVSVNENEGQTTTIIPFEDVDTYNDPNYPGEWLRTRNTINSGKIFFKFPLDKVYGDIISAEMSMFIKNGLNLKDIDTLIVGEDTTLIPTINTLDSIYFSPNALWNNTSTKAQLNALPYDLNYKIGTLYQKESEISDPINSTRGYGYVDFNQNGIDALTLERGNNDSITVVFAGSRMKNVRTGSTVELEFASKDDVTPNWSWGVYPPRLTVVSTGPVAPAVSLTSPADGAVANEGDNITLAANVTQGTLLVSKAEYYCNGTKIGETTAAPHSLTWDKAPVGLNIFNVIVTDESEKTVSSAPVVVTVNSTTPNVSPAVSLTSPAEGASVKQGEFFKLTANASDTDGDIIVVKFLANGTLIATDDRAPFEANWYNIPGGTYTITAKAYDNKGASTVSPEVTVHSLFVPEVVLTSPGQGSEHLVGDPITISADASSQSGEISAVKFYVAGVLVGTDTQAPYSVEYELITNGSTEVKAIVTDEFGQEKNHTISIKVRMPKGPYLGTPATVPGYFYAAHFDEGGNGVSYSDDAVRGGNALFRPGETIDAKDNPNPLKTDNLYCIGTVVAGEWAEYTVDATETGAFDFTVEAAAPRGTTPAAPGSYERGYLALFVDGDSIDAVMIYNTYDAEFGADAWHAWMPFTIADVTLSEGEHIVRWKAFGSYNINRLSFFGENVAPVVSITQPTTAASFISGAEITLTANASDEKEVMKVEFYADDQLLGQDTEAPYSYTWTGAAIGAHQIYAIAYDNDEESTTSSSVNITVYSTESIGQLSAFGANIYPNPWNNGTLTISTSGVSGQTSVIITDLCGKTAYRTLSPDAEIHLEEGLLAKGVWLVHLTSGSQSRTFKLVVK